MKKKSNPHLVVQSNRFINFRHSLSLAEARVFLNMVAQIERDDEDFKSYRIDVKKFINLVGLKGNSSYSVLREVAEGLRDKKFTQVQPDGSFLVTGYISSAEYIAGRSYVELSFDPKLKPFLLNLKEAFTQYDIRYIISLRSLNTVRIYELLKQYEKVRFREFKLEELKFILNLEGKYPRYVDFRIRVLDAAQKELKKSTDISFDYEEIKEGRHVSRIRFIIHSQKNENAEARIINLNESDSISFSPVIVISSAYTDLIQLFTELEPALREDDIINFIDSQQASEAALFDILLYAKQEKQKGIQIRSLLAYIQNGLKTELGKGLSLKLKEGRLKNEQKKQAERDHKEIDNWYRAEFPAYLSYYYEQLGSQASDAVKAAFLKQVSHQIAQQPNLKPIYYDDKGKIKPQQMQMMLGMELFKQSGKTEEMAFKEWVMNTRGIVVEINNGKWSRIEGSLF